MTQFLPVMSAITYQQSVDIEIRTLLLPSVILLYVEEGSKLFWSAGLPHQVASEGEFLLLQSGAELCVRNCVGTGGRYLAQGLVLEGANIDMHFPLDGKYSSKSRSFHGSSAVVEAFMRMHASLKGLGFPDQVKNARFFELKAWLAEQDICIEKQYSKPISHRLQILLLRDLTYPWRVSDVTSCLGMSEATLRRTLAKEGKNFTQILREARLQNALERLQTTEQSLSEIAYSTGFSSHSHFTEVFRKRFRFPPSQLRARRSNTAFTISNVL